MKKNDLLNAKKLAPKPETIQKILNFSKSLMVIKTPQKTLVLCKN